jgi:hypothetical protein
VLPAASAQSETLAGRRSLQREEQSGDFGAQASKLLIFSN